MTAGVGLSDSALCACCITCSSYDLTAMYATSVAYTRTCSAGADTASFVNTSALLVYGLCAVCMLVCCVIAALHTSCCTAHAFDMLLRIDILTHSPPSFARIHTHDDAVMQHSSCGAVFTVVPQLVYQHKLHVLTAADRERANTLCCSDAAITADAAVTAVAAATATTYTVFSSIVQCAILESVQSSCLCSAASSAAAVARAACSLALLSKSESSFATAACDAVTPACMADSALDSAASVAAASASIAD
eukprot:4941-Heterococcus_DN1.PRE.2